MKKANKPFLPLWYILFGYTVFTFSSENYVTVLNCMLSTGHTARIQKQGRLFVPLLFRGFWEETLNKHCVSYTAQTFGLPRLFSRYRWRLGLFIGTLLFGAILMIGSSVAWDIEVEGNKALYSSDIERNLSEMGLEVGSYLPSLDFAAISNEYCLSHKEVAWMSIYRVGTTVKVKIIESEAQNSPSLPPYANIVAKEDAVIESLGVVHGTALVKKGQTVKKGDLLVSGILKGDQKDTLICAEAFVVGRVEKEVSVFIPYKQTYPEAQETTLECVTLDFFGKKINISLKSGQNAESCGTIVKEEVFTLPNGKVLPVSIYLTKRVSYEQKEVLLSKEEALRLGYTTLKNKLSAMIQDGTMLKKNITASATEEGIYVYGTVCYSVDIAETRAFGAES